MSRALHWRSAFVALAVSLLPDFGFSAVLEFRSACRLMADGLPAAFASCATLHAPEDPSRPDGPTVELFVARIAALTSTPRPDPLLIITGGPGQSAIDFYLQAGPAFEQIRRERELILIDQRGTGRSARGFSCEVPEGLSLETTDPDALGDYVDECLDELRHDPRFYTTSVAVQDLDLLRAALGLEQWNVYGISYGTRVAQHYVRRFPERVRAVILDGVVPPDLVLGPDIARYAQRALDTVFERCSDEPRCAERFPDLPARFDALLAAVEAEPFYIDASDPIGGNVEEISFGATHLQAVVRFMSYSSQTMSLLPLLISEAYEGNYRPLVSQTNTILRGLPESLSFPMSNSVICAEDYPFLTERASEGLGATYLGTTILDGFDTICSRWPTAAIDDDFKAPLASDRPTLLLSGDNDPITPPEYAEHAIAGGLSNAKHLIGRGQGHGLAVVGCVPRLLRAFIAKPVPAELDAACLASEPPAPFFLSFLGPAP